MLPAYIFLDGLEYVVVEENNKNMGFVNGAYFKSV